MSDKHTGSTAIPEHASDCSSQCLGGSNLFPMLSRLEQNSKGQALIIPHLIFCLWQQLCCCSFLHCLFSNLLTILNVLPIFFPSRKTPYTLPSPPSPTKLQTHCQTLFLQPPHKALLLSPYRGSRLTELRVMLSEGTYLYHAGCNSIQGFENRLLNNLLHLPGKQDLMRHLTNTGVERNANSFY